MSERRKLGKTNKMVAYVAAGIVHAVIIGALLFNFTKDTKTVEAFDADKLDIVTATTIDESQIKDQQDRLKKLEREKQRNKELEEKRLRDLKREAEREKKRIEDLKKKNKEEQAKARELEAERKKIALQRKKEKDKREKELAEKKKKEAAEKKRKEKIAREKKAADDKRRAEEAAANERLNELLQEEERLRAAQNANRIAKERTTTVSNRYAALIREAVNLKRTIAPDFESWRVATINIKLSPLGEVLDVRTVKSSGSARYDRDAETAIRKASPLPIPTEEEDAQAHKLFRDVTLKFSMPGAG